MAQPLNLDGIDPEEIGRLMDLLAGSDVEECEIQQGDFALSLRRSVRPARASEETAPAPPAEGTGEEEAVVILAPAVGVFTRSEKPSAPPKVEVGARLKPGDVVGYIEVMMVPHSVSSGFEGIVESFLVENGQPVEYGQPLIKLSAISYQLSD
ncbi:MAG: acetyl-CoA carboxylase biotin carboxyl carrier protein [Chloroflexota bacterium]